MIPDNFWLSILDWDSMLLDYNQVSLINEYILRYPDTGLFLARSNRSGSHVQRWNGQLSTQMQMNYWHRQAMNIKPTFKVTEVLNNHISGYLMLVSKKTWTEIPFNEDLQILHVDRDYAARVLAMGKKIRIMDDVLVYHSYRVYSNNKNHLI